MKTSPSVRSLTAALAAAGALALAGLLGPGCANDPFDPASVPNQRPIARIFVSAPEGGELNPTSYYRRTFRWSGSDADGRVVEFYVTIETRRGEAAPWDTTARTDTTMTFATDDDGHAEATIRVACRDDRGAVSETVSVYIPLRNFPPVVNFPADFDTVRWSYGAASFRFFAFDLDGNETLSDSLLYRLDTADTSVVRVAGQPGADPALCWVKKPFDDPEARIFELGLRNLPPGPARTLFVSVTDEARADARFHWTWEVKEARGPVLLCDDSGPFTDQFYYAAMDSLFGPGQWSLYDLTGKLPDRLWVLRDTFRQFAAVLWYTGGSASLKLRAAVPPLSEYLLPPEGQTAGKLLLVSKNVTGAYGNLPPGFVTNVLGIATTSAPANVFSIPAGKQALALRPGLPAVTSAVGFGQAIGMTALTGSESIYQLEYYRYDTRPPYEPIVGVRRPGAAGGQPARSVVISAQLEYFVAAEARAALAALLAGELGVPLP